MSALDYDTDLIKHYVRLNGWLPAAEERRASSKKAPTHLKYLTFCASKAVDVFHLDLKGVIARDPSTENFERVFFCERDAETYQHIAELLGVEGFEGDFSDIVLFEEAGATKGLSLLDPRKRFTHEERLQLRMKDTHERLVDTFPFDIINLDLAGSIFPPDEPLQSRLLEAISQVLEWQTNPREGRRPLEFSLFITTKLDKKRFSAGALKQLIGLVDKNRREDHEYDSAFENTYGKIATSRLAASNFNEFCAVGVSKQLLHEAATLHWKPTYRNVFLYERSQGHKYYMLSIVCHFRWSQADPIGLGRHITNEAIEIVRLRTDAKDVNSVLKNRRVKRAVKADLQQVVSHRDTALA